MNGWRRTFALFPVELLEGGRVWFKLVYKRHRDRSAAYAPIFVDEFTLRPEKHWS